MTRSRRMGLLSHRGQGRREGPPHTGNHSEQSKESWEQPGRLDSARAFEAQKQGCSRGPALGVARPTLYVPC